MLEADALLELYRAAREEVSGAFEERAIYSLKKTLSFESAIWGMGELRRDGSVMPHVAHLHEQPKESLAAWASLNAADPVAARCMATPGRPVRFHAPTLFAGRSATPMREYAKRYGRQSYMVCGQAHTTQASLMVWLSLYRRSADQHFSAAEQGAYASLGPHLHEAQKINRLICLGQATEGTRGGEILAIADPWGYLYTPADEIHEALQGEWCTSRRGRIPFELLEAIGSSQTGGFEGRTLSVSARSVGGLLFLRVRRHGQIPGISAREQQVAQVIAQGLTSKEAARALGLSPATVRVHLRNAYRKLDVGSQAQLAFALGRCTSVEMAPARSLRA